MFKHLLKNWLKANKGGINNGLSWLIKAYLSLVYKTIRWRYVMPVGYSIDEFDNAKQTIFVMWHNMLALAPYAFQKHKQTYVLVSPHSDGQIIANILSRFGYHIIEGSTNRSPIAATRQILRHLASGCNVAITPDGPRGPIHKINSNVIGIAKIANVKIIPVSFKVSNYFRFKSWDRLIMPLPFGRGEAIIGDAISSYDNEELAHTQLENILNKL